MRMLARIAGVLRSLFRSDRIDDDLAEEMRAHVEHATEANIARGMPPDAARRAARLKFGSMDASLERSRDERPGVSLRQLVHDLRFGTRLLAKAPLFSLTAIAIIALGVGSATAIFTVVYGVMLRPLPFRAPEQLVSIWLERGAANLYPSAADGYELRQLRTTFQDIALVRSSNANLSLVGQGDPQRLQSARVSANFFDVLGVAPMLGRTFAADEDQPGRERVVILSEAFWRSRLGSDSTVIGRDVRLDGVMTTVIGIMPSNFQYPASELDAWIPAVLERGELSREFINNYRVIGRLRAHVSLDGARREAAALATRLGVQYEWNSNASFAVLSMLDDTVSTIRPALLLLLGAVTFLLLIACVNLSNLFGARASARSGEFAVRLALGASRTRLIVQAIAEATPLLVLGGVAGVMAASGAVHLFLAAAPPGIPRVEGIAVSGAVIAYSVAVLIVAGVAASIAPAAHAWRSNFTTITKDGGRSATIGVKGARTRRVGVAAQIAFAVPLLVGAALLMRSAMQLNRVDLGFDADRVWTVAFELSATRYPTEQSGASYYTRLIESVRGVPGVTSAAIVNRIPLAGNQTNVITAEHAPEGTELWIDSRTVTSEYFNTLGIPLLAGRAFDLHDDLASVKVGIVDEDVAQRLWPGESAIGKRFAYNRDLFTVVGVVGHIRATNVESDPRPQVYWSALQWVQTRAVLAVRSNADSRQLLPEVTNAIRSVDPEQSVFDARPMQEIVSRSLAQRRVTTALMLAFAVVALLLSAVGIYGVVVYGVSQRRREFGIRVALGARRADVTRLVVWQGTSMALVGTAIGIALAMLGTGALTHLVFGVALRDVTSLVVAAGTLIGVAALASWIPARRAATVDPAVTLRSD